MDLNYHKSRMNGSETDNLDSILVESNFNATRDYDDLRNPFGDYEKLRKNWTTLQEQAMTNKPNIPDRKIVLEIKHNTTINHTSYSNYITPLKVPDSGGGTMVEDNDQDNTWELIKSCDTFLTENIRDRLSSVLEALVSERMQRLGGDKLSALFSLYKEGILETDDVLRFGDIDLYQFREYLNTHNIPYRYEEGYIECLDDFKDLL